MCLTYMFWCKPKNYTVCELKKKKKKACPGLPALLANWQVPPSASEDLPACGGEFLISESVHSASAVLSVLTTSPSCPRVWIPRPFDHWAAPEGLSASSVSLWAHTSCQYGPDPHSGPADGCQERWQPAKPRHTMT